MLVLFTQNWVKGEVLSGVLGLFFTGVFAFVSC